MNVSVPKTETGDHARHVVNQLLDACHRLPDEIRREILALQAPLPALLAILDDTKLASSWAPAHAARLLGELGAVNAVEPMLRLLAVTESHDLVHDQVIQSLPKIGAPVIEPALRAYAGNANRKARYSIAAVLAEVGVHDDRIFEILVDQLRREPSYGAGNLAIYGDPRAVPHLLEALDKFQLVESENPLANHTLIELREAIDELGGTLTAEQQLKCRRGREPAEVFARKLDAMLDAHRREVVVVPPTHRSERVVPVTARSEPRPGRNEPCWCGSATKYKKCHLAADERASRVSR